MVLLLVLVPLALLAATPIEDFASRLTPQARRDLTLDQLRPEGHELATALLKPLREAGKPQANPALRAQADELLRNRVSLLSGYPAQDLGFPYDWFRAPKDDFQWPTHLSRHYYLMPLARAYAATGDERYANNLARVLLDWVKQFPLGQPGLDWRWKAPGTSGEGNFRKYADGPWTSLSAHARTDAWLALLPLIADAPCMTNETTAILLNSLLSTHVRLMLDFPRGGTANQFLAIGSSLVNLSMALPSFAGADECRRVGLDRITEWATRQVYPDGSVAECSPNYGLGSVARLNTLALDLKKRGVEVPAIVFERVRQAVRYYALISDPHGRSPRIAKGGGMILTALQDLNRSIGDPEVAWIASRGTQGTWPARLNYGFDWAGHFVMRSGWGSEDTWLFFEPGPRGSGHHDRAQLGVQLIAGGAALLVDPGYYTYSTSGEEGRMSRYLNSSLAHNTAVADGAGQIGGARGPNAAAGNYAWEDTDDRASAVGEYRSGYGDSGEIKAVHKRRVSWLKKTREFAIEDSFTSAAAHTFEILWQAPPEAKVETGANRAVIRTPKTTATLTFDSAASLAVTTTQGWYSEKYGALEPSTTLRVSLKGSAGAVTTRIAIGQ